MRREAATGRCFVAHALEKLGLGSASLTVVLKANERYYPPKGHPIADKVTIMAAKKPGGGQ